MYANWIVKRMKERSTWTGIIWLLVAVGIIKYPEFKDAVIAYGIGMTAVIWMLTKG